MNGGRQPTVGDRPSETHQPVIRLRRRHHPLQQALEPEARKGIIIINLVQESLAAEGGDDDRAVSDGGAELGEVDGLRAAVGGEGGEAVAGEVGGEQEALEAVGVQVGWGGGDEDWWADGPAIEFVGLCSVWAWC